MNEKADEIYTWLSADPSLARTISAARKLESCIDADAPAIRYAILRNITLEPGLPPSLKLQSIKAGLNPSVYLGDFDDIQQAVFHSQSPLYEYQPDIIILALRLQTLASRFVLQFAEFDAPAIEAIIAETLGRVISLMEAIRERSNAIILIHNFELAVAPAFGILDAQMPQGQQNAIRLLNKGLQEQIAAIKNAYLVDMEHLIARIGYENALDERYWHIGRAPYTFALQQKLAGEYIKFALVLKGKNRKCLVLDCDNTLWGGVIGEDGLNGIQIGATHPGSSFAEFQSAILNLYHRGILLALNTKNNEADVMEVFEKHPGMILKPHHFVAKRINWQDKAANLREIAAELNIGLQSLVFVDDNSFECEYVRETLPEVAVVQLPPEPTRYRQALQDLEYFETLTLSREDRRRSQMYQTESRRTELKKSSASMEQYLHSLEMKLTFARADGFSIPRIAQLTQKTNQFNLTTRRYSEGDIQAMVNDPAWQVYSAQLEDKFDSAGIIAAVLVHFQGYEARIDTFLMSCRVIGRGVEQALLAHIAAQSRERGALRMIGEFIPSAKNGLASSFLSASGFTALPGSDMQWWSFDLCQALPAAPNWFAVPQNLCEGQTT